MAIKRIEKDDLVAKNVLDNLTQGAKESKSAVDLLEKSLKAVVQLTKATKSKVASTSPKDVKSVQELNQLADRSNKLAQNKIRIDKELKKEKERLQMLNAKIKKDLRDEITLEQKQVGTLEKLNIQNRKLREERKKLNLETKKGQQRLKEINGQLDKNNAKIRASSDAMKKQKLNIGNYASAVGKLRGALAQLGLAFGVFGILRNSFKVVKDFEQSQADLASVLGVSKDAMATLTEQAKELGATTTFTASQVAELQKEFAKLGFTQTEIENVTEATLLLAEATGTDLARSAEVTGSTIRAFGLDSSETQRVVDVMAKSFSSSSLDMEKFAVAMRSVAPVAKTAGLNIEQTTALLGTLTDRGLDASTAGTSLRNVFLELSKQGISFDEAMKEINESTDKNATALDLFGKRGATTGVILSETAKDVENLTEKLYESEGASKQMADTQRNTLGGSIKLLQSAWEGVILKMDEAGGIGEKLRKTIQFLADNLETILKTVGLLIKAFTAFKLSLLALKLQSQYRNWVQFNKGVKNTGKGLKASASSARTFGRALKSIGFAVAITLAIEFVNALWKIVEGSKAAARAEELRGKVVSKGEENVLGKIEKVNKEKEKKIQALKDERELNKITQKEYLDGVKKAENATKKQFEDNIKLVKKRKKEYQKEFLLNKEILRKQFGLNSTGGQANLASAELAESLNLEGLLPEKKKKLLALVKQQELIQAKIASTEKKISLYTNEIVNNEQQIGRIKHQSKVVIQNNVKEVEKEVSLLEEIRQARIAIIEDDQIRELKQRQNTFNNLVAETKLKKTNKKEYDDWLKAQEELLQFDLEAIREKYRQENKKSQSELQSDINELFDGFYKDKELKLLKSGKTEEEVDKELLEFKKKNLKERIELLQQYGIDTIDLEIELQRLSKKKTIESETEKFEIQKASIDLATEYFIKRADERIDKINEEMEMAKKQSDYFRQLASEGNISAKESLAEQNKIIAEANAQKEREEKRKQRILLVSSVLQAYNSELEKGEDSGKAIMKALTSTTLITQFVNALPAFAEGTENTSLDGRGKNVDGKGGFHAILHQNERVMTAKQNKMIGDYSNNEVASIMEKHRLGKLMPDSQIMIGLGSHELVNKLMNVEQKLDQVTKAIQDKPIPNIELGEITQSYMVINKRVEGGKGTTTSKFKVQ